METGINLVPYNPLWKAIFQREKHAIETSLPADFHIHVKHIGSTAVKNMIAVPIVDVIVGVDNPIDVVTIKDRLIYRQKYELLEKQSTIQHFVLVHKENNEVASIIHVVPTGSNFYRKALAFTNLLITNQDEALRYIALKADAVDEKKFSPEQYQNAKINYINTRVL